MKKFVSKIIPVHSKYLKRIQLHPEYLNFLNRLTPRQRFVVEERLKGRVLRDIGSELCVSGERIRQIEAKASRRLTWFMHSHNSPVREMRK